MSRDIRGRNRKLLVAGAAGLLIAAPFAPHGIQTLSAADPAARHPQSMLQRIVDREAHTLTADASGSASIVTAAGEQPAMHPQQNAAEFQQQYGSEVQRQLQKLYQQDGRTMPQMVVPQMQTPPSTYQRAAAPRRFRLKDVFSPSAWRDRFSRPQSQQEPPTPPEFSPADDNLGPAGTLSQGFIPPPAPAATELPARPELQRYSPEIFAGDEEPVAASPAAAGNAAQQPGFFPGAVPAPVTASAAPATTASAAPLLIIVPDQPAVHAGTEPILVPAATPQAASIPESFAAPGAGDPLRALPSLESALTVPPAANSTASRGVPSLDLVEPNDAALSNPFPEMPEAEADAAAGPYTGLELENSPYESTGELTVPADTGAFAAPAPQAQPAGPQLADVSPLRPAAEHGPVLIAPGATVPSELPLVQPGRSIEAAAPQAADGTRSSSSDKMARIASRQGLTGFKGFCPVMLRDFRELVDASQDFSVIYQGQQYWFSSDDAKQAFVANPGAYMAAGGGIDPVVYHQSGQSVSGSLDNAVWYHGQLYLFSSQVTKAEFVASPRAHAFE